MKTKLLTMLLVASMAVCTTTAFAAEESADAVMETAIPDEALENGTYSDEWNVEEPEIEVDDEAEIVGMEFDDFSDDAEFGYEFEENEDFQESEDVEEGITGRRSSD